MAKQPTNPKNEAEEAAEELKIEQKIEEARATKPHGGTIAGRAPTVEYEAKEEQETSPGAALDREQAQERREP